jgi:phytoene dehydrogenase-like protein
VHQVRTRAGRAVGVQLKDGEEVSAGIVVSNADPKHTFLSLVPAEELHPEFVRAVRAIKMDGPCAKLNMVLSRAPQLRGLDAGASDLQRASFTIVPWLDDAQRCYERSRQGSISEELWIDCLVPSLVDSTLAPAGRHVMTCFIQYLPYRLAGTNWDAQREPLTRQILRQIESFVPGLSDSIVATRLYTPADLESVLGITEGNIFHGDLRLDQLFFMRPLPAYARYATPVRALYLCGAGTHPGGGVTGAPGFNAARRILCDLSRDRSLRKGLAA